MLTGDNLYLFNKFKQQIIQYWMQHGESDQQKFELTTLDCWHNLFQATNTSSLFHNRQLFIAHTNKTSFDNNIQVVITKYLQQNPDSNTLILITAPEVTAKSLQFLTALPNNSVVNIKTPNVVAIKQWINMQLAKRYSFSADLVEFIFNQTEGNLVATAQSITKIILCHPNPQALTIELVSPHVTAQYNFQVFDFTNQILAGKFTKALTVLRHILQDHNEFHLMLWQVAQILRQLYKIHFYKIHQKQDLNTAIKNAGIWSNQIVEYKRLNQILQPATVQELLILCQKIDYDSKTGNYSQAVRQLEMCIHKLCDFKPE
jgi:DNA polymerase III delta subunit